MSHILASRFHVIRLQRFNLLATSLLAAQIATAASFLTTGAMPVARDSHTSTLLLDGRVLIAGGSDGTNALANATLYEPLTGAWKTTGSLRVKRQPNRSEEH